MAPHLFRCWPRVASRIRSASTLRLFLDFDGTLASLCATPREASLDDESRRALERLSRHPRLRAAIVSGRRRSDLIQRVRLPRLEYWGLYGWERQPGRRLPLEMRKVLSCACGHVAWLMDDLPGVWVEDKGLAFSVHVRDASPWRAQQARHRLRHVLAGHATDLHLVPGDSVWNVLPRQVPGKGAAVRQAIARIRTPFLPIYVGDDTTDESAFLLLKRGITVRVGPARRTHARYRVSDPDEVRSFIERIDQEWSARRAAARPGTGGRIAV